MRQQRNTVERQMQTGVATAGRVGTIAKERVSALA